MSELPKSLARIGIDSHEKALLVAPATYRDYTAPVRTLPEPDAGSPTLVRVTVLTLAFFTRSNQEVAVDGKDIARIRAVVADDRGSEAQVLSFSDLAWWKKVRIGGPIYLYGELTLWKGGPQFKEPALVSGKDVGRVVPVYIGRQGLTGAEAVKTGVMVSQHALGGAATLLLEKVAIPRAEFEVISGYSPEQLLADIHWPTDAPCAIRALKAARTLTLGAVSAQVRRSREKAPAPESVISISVDVLRDLVRKIPFTLTEDQRRSIWEIVKDLRSPYSMRRMLSGDVGTGKTVTYLIPAAAAYLAGASVAILAPGKLLVTQLANELRGYFPDIPVTEVTSGVKLPESGIVIGTTAVTLAAESTGRKFQFVITDEQHKFSVAQRKTLLADGANLLEATATAIPRTVALVAMGGQDVSTLRQCPVEKDIKSRIIRRKGKGLFTFIKEQIAAGGQVAVIYPLVESDKTDTSVARALERFAKPFGNRVGFIHGRQKNDVKDETIRRMKAGEIDILLSSTVIEVGLTLPSLKVMVVVNPEHFGASQLHQLRGRLARHGGKGFFFMFLKDNKSPKPETLARLRLLVGCSDGFELSEKDAQLRGAGAVFDEMGNQSGSTRSIFHGIDLSYADIEQAANAAIQG